MVPDTTLNSPRIAGSIRLTTRREAGTSSRMAEPALEFVHHIFKIS